MPVGGSAGTQFGWHDSSSNPHASHRDAVLVTQIIPIPHTSHPDALMAARFNQTRWSPTGTQFGWHDSSSNPPASLRDAILVTQIIPIPHTSHPDALLADRFNQNPLESHWGSVWVARLKLKPTRVPSGRSIGNANYSNPTHVPSRRFVGRSVQSNPLESYWGSVWVARLKLKSTGVPSDAISVTQIIPIPHTSHPDASLAVRSIKPAGVPLGLSLGGTTQAQTHPRPVGTQYR